MLSQKAQKYISKIIFHLYIKGCVVEPNGCTEGSLKKNSDINVLPFLGWKSSGTTQNWWTTSGIQRKKTVKLRA